ncbi:hypothetical protein [Marinagarivorans cellulosilyticus]|uniref:Uncharacterized protein n=1 Tax=Marinagarivorans cellulosilyticus TaxID=2721545 RepID=A0AAN1WHF3_9GAMM|nr:hypothetical protein [Marinagarivorans cellulosilyticus]BCD97675.1 hypothetical protein MARGE09_P1876 [Marinagarivorans cellulosilyticus]
MDKVPFECSIKSVEKTIANKQQDLTDVKSDIALVMDVAEFHRQCNKLSHALGRVLGELEYSKPKPAKRKSLVAEQKSLERKIRRLKRLNIAQLFEREWLLSDSIAELTTELNELKVLSGVVKQKRTFSVGLMQPVESSKAT